MLYMVTFTINIPPVLAYIPYMDPMGDVINIFSNALHFPRNAFCLAQANDPWNASAFLVNSQ